MSLSQIHTELLIAAESKLTNDMRQIARCVQLLGDALAWQRANENCNSVANLLLHLDGNLRQWILGGVGKRSVARDRAGEFAARDVRPIAPLVSALAETVGAAVLVIRAQTPESLCEPRIIQRYSVSVFEAILHVVEHFSFHTGQIVHMTKALLDVGLSRYDANGWKDGVSGGKPW